MWSTATGSLSPLVLLGKKTTDVLTVSPDGDVFIVGAGAGPLMGVRREEATPTWTSAEEVGGPGAFSPDGTLIAFPGFFGGIAFLDAETGRLASESDQFGEGPWQITWEDEETVLAVDRNAPRDALCSLHRQHRGLRLDPAGHRGHRGRRDPDTGAREAINRLSGATPG